MITSSQLAEWRQLADSQDGDLLEWMQDAVPLLLAEVDRLQDVDRQCSVNFQIARQLEQERDVARAEVARLTEALDHETGPSCSSCGNAIDPDCCWCGTAGDRHQSEEHGFVPMGCDCSRDPRDRDWNRCASELRSRLWQEKHRASELEAGLEAACDEIAKERDDARTRITALETRQQELLVLTVRLTNETPFPYEIKGWEGQRAALLAEVGTLRAERDEARREPAELARRLAATERELDAWRERSRALASTRGDAVSDLTEEQLQGMAMWDRDVMLAPEHRAVGAMLVGMAIAEIQRHRAAVAADRERVRAVVRQAAWQTLDLVHTMDPDTGRAADLIAARAADQLATANPSKPLPTLTDYEQNQLLSVRSMLSSSATSDLWQREIALLDHLIAVARSKS